MTTLLRDRQTAGTFSPLSAFLLLLCAFLLASAGLALAQAPANDGFADRIALSGSSLKVAGDNTGATLETGEPNHAGYSSTRSVWWEWTAPATGRASVLATTSSGFLPVMAVYSGTSLPALTHLAGGFCSCPVGLDVRGGEKYQIAVAGYSSGSFGAIQLSVEFTAAPANDGFADRIALSGASVKVAGDNTGATLETGEPNHAGYSSTRSVWWEWTAPATGRASVLATTSSGFLPVMAVYSGTSLPALTHLAGGFCSCPVGLDVRGGEKYQIAVAGYSSGSFGAIQLSVEFTAAPANDGFADRIALSGASVKVAGDNTGATLETGEPAHYDVSRRHSVWWEWTAPATGRARVSSDGSGFDSVVAVYTGTSLPVLTQLASVDSGPAGLDVRGGEKYQIAVAGWDWSSFGSIQLSVEFTPPPANDNFAHRVALSGASFSITNHNLGSSVEAGEPNHAGTAPSHSVWWVWRAPANGPVVVATVESDFDTAIAIYTGSVLTNLTAIASNADAGARRAVFVATEGTEYVIAIDGKNGSSGNLRLTLGQNTPDPAVQLAAPQADKLTASIPREAFQLGWHFESSTDLVNWSQVSDPPVLTDTEASVTMDTSVGSRFFRPSNQIVYTGGGGGGIIWIPIWIWIP